MGVRPLLLAASFVIIGCGDEGAVTAAASTVAVSSSGGEPSSITGTSTTATSAAASSGTAADVSASAPESDTSGTTSDGVECPAPDETVSLGGATVLQAEWPSGPTHDAVCDLVGLFDSPPGLIFSCAHPTTGEPTEIRVRIPPTVFDGPLADRVGETGMHLAFYLPAPTDIYCTLCPDLSVRDADGRLVFLAQSSDYAATLDPGDTIELRGPGWLEPSTPEYDAFSAPFTSIQLTNVGCASRPSIEPGSMHETPLAVVFDDGDDTVTLHDRQAMLGVSVGGGTFDLRVSDAFSRNELACNCPAMEVAFTVVSSE